MVSKVIKQIVTMSQCHNVTCEISGDVVSLCHGDQLYGNYDG